MKQTGVILLILGVIGALFFFVGFDTSVAVPETGDRVNNIGLLNTRLIGVIISLFLVLIGVLLMVFGSAHPNSDSGGLRMSSGGFGRASQFHDSGDSMADRLEELDRRKSAAQKAGLESTVLEQLKKNVKRR